jgi:two-component system response regulator HydG
MGEDKRLLLVDDDSTAMELIQELLGPHDIDVEFSNSFDEAVEKLQQYNFQVIVSDIKMPGKSGVDLLDFCVRQYPEIPVIMLTGYATIQSAVEALKKGAFDYLSKPVQIEALIMAVEKAISHVRLKEQNLFLKKQLEQRDDILYETSNPYLQGLYHTIEDIKNINSTVLLQGESGTGKEIIAQMIHRSSGRGSESFVPINCGAIPENLIESELFGYEKGAFTDAKERTKGKLEIANGGTLFLDEIDELPLKAQVALLRFLQERVVVPLGSSRRVKVNVRIIAATNQDVKAKVEEGSFREDLYYRINVIPLTLPPLRERQEDIIPLARWFLKKFSHEYNRPLSELNRDAEEALLKYTWPGNIRELRNTIERVTIMGNGEKIGVSLLALPVCLERGAEAEFEKIGVIPLKELEEKYIDWVISRMGGNKTKAAGCLGISVRGLRYKLHDETNTE